LGAGAHSHIAGERWWNLKHPKSYIDTLEASNSPSAGSEILSEADKEIESVMLRIRMREGLALAELTDSQRVALDSFYQRGLFIAEAWHDGRGVLSLEGRLLADQIVREVLSH
jgi:oxygen-independent coproporphyrinogen-3 oxidase